MLLGSKVRMAAFLISIVTVACMFALGHTAGHKDCRSVQSIRDRILQGHVIRTTTGKSFERCTIDCEREADCYSVNYLPVTATCQMNNKAVKGYPMDFVAWPGAIYMDSLEREYDPCANRIPACNGICIVAPGSLVTACVCLHNNTSACHPDDCKTSALGMESGAIKTDQIRSSSVNVLDANDLGRLNDIRGAWAPVTDDEHQWYQVTFLPNTKVLTRIATQGYGSTWWWVINYTVRYRLSSLWRDYCVGSDTPKVFSGNKDRTSIVTNTFTNPIIADTIKIIPTQWRGRIALRIELYGCNLA